MDNRLTALLGIRHPIVLGPFGGMSSTLLTAAVSAAGGLGSFGLYGFGADRIAEVAASLRAATDAPFALNLWMPTGDEVTPDQVDVAEALAVAAPLYAELGLEVPTAAPEHFLVDAEEQLDAVLAARPAALSVVFGMPSPRALDALHSRGIPVVATATTVAEAIAVTAAGADAVVATGAEAGGHRVSFLRPAEESLVGTFALVPQVVDAVDVPVIAAGGIADRRGVAAAFALGADGVQVGTAFLRTAESAASPAHREALRAARDDSTVLTRAVTGRLARGIPNRLIRLIDDVGAILPFPAQAWVLQPVRAEGLRRGWGDLQSLWAGQSATLARGETANDVFDELAQGLPRA